MSAEHLLNDDLPDDTRPLKPALESAKPTYYDLMTLRLEAGARLARAIKTLRDANVLPTSGSGATLLTTALEVAERHFADICMGLVPVREGTDVCTIKMREDLPACVEAFRIVVMEHAQREALERECRNMIDHVGGFKILTQPQVLHVENKHVCNGDCDHDSETV
ncbi:hypothetical protein pEaSNUABM17_00321 [Erwinia phage pEa_SNUABM_17]|uniref:Uncharacterized protein n=1 Tax=Erwinia phage pEa_SNUABM_17 TaxID=2869545 RepID=A0AAE8C075_9CAUD|nr:hypothetical protein MPK72_gp321 [Erwinia phage pEa_SNUABM_17]QZE57867.1 hypothetical protein pEaSNUABM17_00321 [Erwinia phage pEa_SNUABM_17]